MQIGGLPRRCRLKVDLTAYDLRCKEGILGTTIPDTKLSVWGSQDRFVAVNFDNGASLDILYKSLEFLEEPSTPTIMQKQAKKPSVRRRKVARNIPFVQRKVNV